MVTALIIAAVVGALASAGAGIYTAYKNSESVKETNEANKEINETNNAFNAEEAEKTRVFNADEAQKQRDFQAEQSATAIQRRAADLQAAGFNPALAISSGGASTPGAVGASGGQANASGYIPMKATDYSPVAQMANNLSHMVTSAIQIKKLDHLLSNDPKTAYRMTQMAKMLNSSMTSAGKVDTTASLANYNSWKQSSGFDF